MIKTRIYLLNLCSLIASSMSVKFAKKSPEDLAHWIEDQVGSKPFIALIKLSSSEGLTPALTNFDFSFVSSVSLEYDPTDEEKIQAEQEAEEQAMSFLYLLKQTPGIKVSNWLLTETFRANSFNGIGKGLTLSVSVVDSNGYCDLEIPDYDSLIC